MISHGNNRKLLTPEREALILEALGNGVRTISELAATLQVSEATVRRDLRTLEQRGALQRVHGGAVRVDDGEKREPLFHEKTTLRADEKERIAEAALGLIEDGDSIYLDGGSTVLALARKLSSRHELTVVTNSLMAAAELMESGHKLILLGGEFRPLSRTLVGPLTSPIGEALHIGKAFFGTIGLTASGVSTTDPGEAFTKKLILGRAEQAILLADSGKIGRTSLVDAGKLDDFSCLVTDSGASPDFLKILKKHRVEFIIA
ncbi:DeoR/GlpR family DNA-binding transcription regulator [uncultured Victivallis sp.]|uniref:DeoR/GlpR family DNA-binding transcription regulator n=1 Tax=uncultured Victivallis sp. TaxID=354118 RepID=UPI0025FA58D0|nr:DeoR/GlpR family DNA-binding transcription regulator [uncultured Victivallis sp.]